MTEFEEITLKKIIKNKMVEDFYVNLNVLLGASGIRNKELSSKIGWDAAGYNQKLNRRSDLKLSTLIYMCMALMDLTDEKNQTGYTFYDGPDQAFYDRGIQARGIVSECQRCRCRDRTVPGHGGKAEDIQVAEILRSWKEAFSRIVGEGDPGLHELLQSAALKAAGEGRFFHAKDDQ